jgi:hypothetical protein
MRQKKCILFFGLLIFIQFILSANQLNLKFDRYHTIEELNRVLNKIVKQFPKVAHLHQIATSPKKHKVVVLEIGPEVGQKKTQPAIFVAANLGGTVPISTEAALKVIQLVLEKKEHRTDKTWYFLPLGNPDAAERYFKRPLNRDNRNATPFNDDKDDAVDEDGVEDLDGNGIITQMRVKDPEGIWLAIPGEPRMMKKADWVKGEKGVYKLYSEGIDNDQDGFYNEDGPGGVDISLNFPHLFKFFTKSGGLWAGNEEESFKLIKFINSHKEIAMTINLGESNFCLNPPRGGRKGTADFSKIKIPERIGKRLNIDTSRTYTMKEIMEMVKQFVPPGFEITESMVASFLGLGAVVNPLPGDLKFYKELSEQYKTFLKKNKMDTKRLDPMRAKDGSFELWAYYHLGLPSFSLDFWTLPQLKKEKKGGPDITPEKLENMSNEEFLALGEEKIDAFLKESGAPANVKAKMIINAVKGGMMTTKRMAAMMREMPKPKSKEGGDPTIKALLDYSDKNLQGKGFVPWKKYKHPTLGLVEIGGATPYSTNTPPPRDIKKLLEGQVPWILALVKKIPRIKIHSVKSEKIGGGLYRIKAWVENAGYLPYPTEIGVRNNRIPPVVVAITGKNIKIISGKKRNLIKNIAGQSTKLTEWIILSTKPVDIQIMVKTPMAWNDTKILKLGV